MCVSWRTFRSAQILAFSTSCRISVVSILSAGTANHHTRLLETVCMLCMYDKDHYQRLSMNKFQSGSLSSAAANLNLISVIRKHLMQGINVCVCVWDREPGVWALERAKQNVMENFLLVGILEELEDVLLLLERLLPHYFSNVLSIYHSPGTRQAKPM